MILQTNEWKLHLTQMQISSHKQGTNKQKESKTTKTKMEEQKKEQAYRVGDK